MPGDPLKPVRLSRRHFFKAMAVAAGAVAVPGRAHAQWGGDHGGGGFGDGGHPWGGGSGWGGGDPWHGGGGDGDGDGDDHGGGGYHCFLRGTRIRMADGSYRAIETLNAGEILSTRFSGKAAVKHIISFTLHRDETGAWPEDTRPVRIGAGALGPGTPMRDLFVTEAHAVFLDGVLIPIGSLVNGKTIALDGRTGPLDFFHVEFAHHDVIDAEGAPCESRRDDAMAACAPVMNFTGRRSEVMSHLRSALAPIMDRRSALDRIRDRLEIRAGL